MYVDWFCRVTCFLACAVGRSACYLVFGQLFISPKHHRHMVISEKKIAFVGS